jgi:hypothetical protein
MDPFDRQLPVRRECHADGCDTSFEDNGRWTPERRPGSDWFIQRNGWTWCPDHTPDWVAEWRKKKENSK